MFILLPSMSYLLIALILKKHQKKTFTESVTITNILFFSLITISTEFLSYYKKILPENFILFWGIITVFCIITVLYFLKKRVFGNNCQRTKAIPTSDKIIFSFIVLILTTTFTTALLYPPNTWDSMTYHMPRVMHWINNHEVSFYSTSINRQNYQMPLSEFAILHFQLLSGSDTFANTVQWLNFFALICLAHLVAAQLGLTKKGQLLSALFVATLPMAILQASSTQNDLVVSFFVLAFGYYMLRLKSSFTLANLSLATLALGLALLSKGTAYLYCAGLGTALGISILRKYPTKNISQLKVMGGLSCILLLALAMNAGHLIRNYNSYGHPLSTEGKAYRNEQLTGQTLLSNALRNGALHLGTPILPFNEHVEEVVKIILGQELNSPKITWAGTSFHIPFSLHEDTAGNLLHFIAIVVSFLLFPVLWVRNKNKVDVGYALGIVLAATFYCLILKWQPWASRLHTPLFIMSSPIVALTLTTGLGAVMSFINSAFVVLLITSSLFFSFRNSSRSFVSFDWIKNDREVLYFTNRPNLFSKYKRAIQSLPVTAGQEVGLCIGNDDWEYPFWILSSPFHDSKISFRHIGVEGIFGIEENLKELPQFILATRSLKQKNFFLNYEIISTDNYITVLRKKTMATENRKKAHSKK